MPAKEPVQYFKALSLLNALKRKNLLAMVINNYVIKGSGTKAIYQNKQFLSILIVIKDSRIDKISY